MSQHTMTRKLFLVFFLCCGTAFASGDQSAKEKAKAGRKKTTKEFKPRVLMKPRRAIVDAPFILADEVKDQVSDNELVLGVVINGVARAYPINMLTGPSREIINDKLGKREIAATW